MDTIVAKFNATINELITMSEKKIKKEEEMANIELLRRRINLSKRIMGPHSLCEGALPHFLKYKDQILERNDAFFLNLNVKSQCVTVGKEDEFLFELIDQLKNYYLKASVLEKTKLWNHVTLLFELCLEYDLNK